MGENAVARGCHPSGARCPGRRRARCLTRRPEYALGGETVPVAGGKNRRIFGKSQRERGGRTFIDGIREETPGAPSVLGYLVRNIRTSSNFLTNRLRVIAFCGNLPEEYEKLPVAAPTTKRRSRADDGIRPCRFSSVRLFPSTSTIPPIRSTTRETPARLHPNIFQSGPNATCSNGLGSARSPQHTPRASACMRNSGGFLWP